MIFDIPWQDVVLGVGSVVFFFALLLSIFSSNKPSVWTSTIYGTTLTTFGFTFLTLDLYLSAGGSFLTAGAWFTLLVQKVLSNR